MRCCEIACFASQDGQWRALRRQCETTTCAHLPMYENDNCLHECMSRPCYQEVYGAEPVSSRFQSGIETLFAPFPCCSRRSWSLVKWINTVKQRSSGALRLSCAAVAKSRHSKLPLMTALMMCLTLSDFMILTINMYPTTTTTTIITQRHRSHCNAYDFDVKMLSVLSKRLSVVSKLVPLSNLYPRITCSSVISARCFCSALNARFSAANAPA